MDVFLFLGCPGLLDTHVIYDVIIWELRLSSSVLLYLVALDLKTSLYVSVFMQRPGTRVDSYMYNMQGLPTPKKRSRERIGTWSNGNNRLIIERS